MTLAEVLAVLVILGIGCLWWTQEWEEVQEEDASDDQPNFFSHPGPPRGISEVPPPGWSTPPNSTDPFSDNPLQETNPFTNGDR